MEKILKEDSLVEVNFSVFLSFTVRQEFRQDDPILSYQVPYLSISHLVCPIDLVHLYLDGELNNHQI
jgi:hypothetical protein